MSDNDTSTQVQQNEDGSWSVAGFHTHYSAKQWAKIKATMSRREWGIRVIRVSDSLADNPPRIMKYDPAAHWAAIFLRACAGLAIMAVLTLAVIIV